MVGIHQGNAADISAPEHDRTGRLIAFPGKVETACPVQDARTALILAIGQSNAGNHGASREVTNHPEKVLNVFDGKCYVAASPLLGATGEGGEFLTPLADRLIEDGLYDRVLIVAAAVGGTPIVRWQKGGDLNEHALAVLKALPTGYRVTEVIWHQGESDRDLGTSGAAYRASFASLLGTLRDAGVDAPVFIGITTICGTAQGDGTDLERAQAALVDNRSVFLGVNADALLDAGDRQADHCHLSASGQRKVAAAYAAAIAKSRTGGAGLSTVSAISASDPIRR
ncbi:MAG TPA: sialate O-acetylesterase [Reyranella sp.]|nr:sialate O-acetylesterase [Reyranella sp.]